MFFNYRIDMYLLPTLICYLTTPSNNRHQLDNFPKVKGRLIKKNMTVDRGYGLHPFTNIYPF